jgi:hypothetical protein
VDIGNGCIKNCYRGKGVFEKRIFEVKFFWSHSFGKKNKKLEATLSGEQCLRKSSGFLSGKLCWENGVFGKTAVLQEKPQARRRKRIHGAARVIHAM